MGFGIHLFYIAFENEKTARPAERVPSEGDVSGHITSFVPFAGIIRIRCGGFDLSPV